MVDAASMRKKNKKLNETCSIEIKEPRIAWILEKLFVFLKNNDNGLRLQVKTTFYRLKKTLASFTIKP